MTPGPAADVRAMLRTLDLEGEADVPDLPWLEASWADPEPFFRALFDDARAFGAPLKTKIGVACDLYADAIQRHVAPSRAAFIWYSRRTGWRSISYADLDALAGARATSWVAQGVLPGQVVAIVQELGADALVSIAAALRLGACLSFVAPAGDLHVSRRLENVAPDHVVVDAVRPPPLGAFAARALDTTASGPAFRAPAYAYGPKEPWAQIVSPVAAPGDMPVKVSAERALLHALRDGPFALGLSPGAVIAAPGAHPTQHVASLLLASLVAGATYLHIEVGDIEADPSLLRAQPVDVLVVGDALRRAMTSRPPGPLPRLRLWLRHVDDPLDWAAWRAFVDANGLEGVPAANVLADAGEGCCAMFSPRRPGSVHARALPSAGAPWKLGALTGGPAGDVGLFTRIDDGRADPAPAFVLARARGEYLFGGSVTPRRGARVYPAAEVESWASSLESVRGACVVPVASQKAGGGSLFSLCVFAPAGAKSRARAALDRDLAPRLGPDALPDAIELFDVVPRGEGGKVDHPWCARQYLSGRLRVESDDPRFQTITALRGALTPPRSK